MTSLLGVVIGIVFVVVVVAIHFAPGTERAIPNDISQEVLEHRAESLPETEFAEPMSRAIGGGAVPAGAVGGGGAEGELAEEESEAEESESRPAEIPDDEAETFEIEYVKQDETLEVKENQSLLEAGEDHGWDLPYACRQGQCLSCGAHVADGPSEDYVFHDGNEMLSEDELDDGYMLTCVGYPTADLSVETGETP